MMQIIASAMCALTIYSTLSAMSSLRRKRIKHAVMAHCDSVVNGNGIEFGGKTSLRLNHLFNPLPDFMQVHVPGDELRERIGDRNDRLAESVPPAFRWRARGCALQPSAALP